jgi:general secretion pathway protein H
MPTSAPGSSCPRGRAPRGFTLIELLVVVAIVALAAGAVVLSLRDGTERQLEQEGTRLAALLEGARAEARAGALNARWQPGDGDFRFTGLPDAAARPTRWLDERVRAEVVGAPALVLGPDAILPPQRIVLRLADRRLELASDGLAAFAPAAATAP